MSSNRQQLATGLKAILGGGQHVREVPSFPAQPEQESSTPSMQPFEAAPAFESAPAVAIEERVATVAPESQVERAPRKPRRQPEPLPQLPTGSRVGTLERPYVRQRDNQATRKVGVVLPVDLADELQIHCVRARMRPNAFIEQAIADALGRVR